MRRGRPPSTRSSAGPRRIERLMSCPGGKTMGRTVSANGLSGVDLRQKTEAAEVDAEEGNATRCGETCAGEKCAIASQGEDQRGVLEPARDRVDRAIPIALPCFGAMRCQCLECSLDHRFLG